MNWQEVLFVGDSMTHGSRDAHGLAWPYYLCHEALRDGVVIFPHINARPGRTSSEMLREAADSIWDTPVKEAFLLVGTNDAKDEVDTPPALYRANVTLLYGWMAARGMRPFVLTLPKPNGFGSPGYTAEIAPRIAVYNTVLRAHFGSNTLIDVEDVSDMVDGIHWTAAANQEVARRVWVHVKRRRTWHV